MRQSIAIGKSSYVAAFNFTMLSGKYVPEVCLFVCFLLCPSSQKASNTLTLSCYNRFFIFFVVTGPFSRRRLLFCCLKLLLTTHFARHPSWLFVLVTVRLLLLAWHCIYPWFLLHLSTFQQRFARVHVKNDCAKATLFSSSAVLVGFVLLHCIRPFAVLHLFEVANTDFFSSLQEPSDQIVSSQAHCDFEI